MMAKKEKQRSLSGDTHGVETPAENEQPEDPQNEEPSGSVNEPISHGVKTPADNQPQEEPPSENLPHADPDREHEPGQSNDVK